MRSRLFSLVALLVTLSPGVAAACAVCFSGRTEDSRIAFEITTAFLTFLPLLMIGSLAWWLRRRARALALATSPARPDPTNAHV